MLNDKRTRGITAFLTQPGTVIGKPYRLRANAEKAFQGSIVLGMGFVMEPEEAERLLAKNPRNRDVLFPYLNGEDVNSRFDQSPSRWVINFFDWPLDHETAPEGYTGPVAANYPDCLAIVVSKVKPERDKLGLKKDSSAQGYAKWWWQYARRGVELYVSIAGKDRVLVIPETTKYCAFSFSPSTIVYSHMTKVVALNGEGEYALLSSSLHEDWVRFYSSTLETRLKYIISDAFETFPFPASLPPALVQIGERYHGHRRLIMLSRQEGLTKTYNRFHNQEEAASDIVKLRQLHAQMDQSVAEAYGWTDLDLGHGFHQTKQGLRYTISESARQEVLGRLLKLNHERYAEEVKQGLHETKKGKGKRRKQDEEARLFE